MNSNDVAIIGIIAFFVILLIVTIPFAVKDMEKKDEERKKRKAEGYELKKVCPYCSSQNFQPFVQQTTHAAQTKTKYSANINPLKPLTFVNKNEKVVRPSYTTSETRWQCQECGKIFKRPFNKWIK